MCEIHYDRKRYEEFYSDDLQYSQQKYFMKNRRTPEFL